MTDRRPSLLYRIMCWSRFGWHHGYTTKVGLMYVLHFPLWVRIVSRFQHEGNDGLTNIERRHLAGDYARREAKRRYTTQPRGQRG